VLVLVLVLTHPRRYYPGTVVRVRSNGTYDILYDDGEKEVGIYKEMIRAAAGGPASPKKNNARANFDSSADDGGFRMGQACEAKYRGDEWLPGVIKMARPGDVYDVTFDNGKFESRIRKELVREKRGGRSSPDDFAHVESPGNSDNEISGKRFTQGQKIEARYRGKAKWYKGEVARVRLNGNIDVRYDDGDKDDNLDPEMVRAFVSVSREPSSPARRRRGSFANANISMEGSKRGGGRSVSPEGRSPRSPRRRLDDID